MTDEVNPKITDAVTIDNVKTVAGSGAEAQAMLSKALSSALGIMISEATASSSRRAAMADQAMGAVLNKMVTMDPNEAISISKAMTGNDTATMMSQLLAALNSGQQGTKSAQTTPPVTASS